MRLVILTGASGSGKTAIATYFARHYGAQVEVFHFDTIGVPDEENMKTRFGSPEAWQRAMTHRWIERLSKCGSLRILFEGSIGFDVLEDALRVYGLGNVRVILADCSDEERKTRLLARGQPDLATDAMLLWAANLRTQARADGYDILDTTARPIHESAAHIAAYFKI